MKKIVRYALSILVGLSYVSCKEKTETVTLTKEIIFTKEGELSLLKKDNDSLLARIDIEIADDEYQTQTGLMYRHSMAQNQGMLFIFEDESPRSFYMKNTEIALDIIYIDAKKKVVSIQKNAQPFNETSLPSDAPAKFVLEVNAGLSETWNLETGDKISW